MYTVEFICSVVVSYTFLCIPDTVSFSSAICTQQSRKHVLHSTILSQIVRRVYTSILESENENSLCEWAKSEAGHVGRLNCSMHYWFWSNQSQQICHAPGYAVLHTGHAWSINFLDPGATFEDKAVEVQQQLQPNCDHCLLLNQNFQPFHLFFFVTKWPFSIAQRMLFLHLIRMFFESVLASD